MTVDTLVDILSPQNLFVAAFALLWLVAGLALWIYRLYRFNMSFQMPTPRRRRRFKKRLKIFSV